MTTRFVQPGKVLDYANGGTPRASGDVIVIGTKVGVALTAIPANTPGSVQICGVFTVPKLSSDTPAQGALLYWDAANSRMTTTSSGNTLAGVAAAAAGNGAASVNILLNGTPA